MARGRDEPLASERCRVKLLHWVKGGRGVPFGPVDVLGALPYYCIAFIGWVVDSREPWNTQLMEDWQGLHGYFD